MLKGMVKMARRKCPGCGKFIANNAIFCIFCNEELESEEFGNVEETESYVKEKEKVQEKTSIQEVGKNDLEEKEFPLNKNKEIMEDIEESDDYVEDKDESEDCETEEYESEIYEEECEGDYIEDDDKEFDKIIKRSVSNTQEASPIKEKKTKKEKSYYKEDEIRTPQNPKKMKSKAVLNEMFDMGEKQKKSETFSKEENSYDSNSDGYYDNMIALIDARIDHITKESVVRTIGLFTICVILIFGMVYFVL